LKKTFVIAFIFGFLISCGVQKIQKPISNYTQADLEKIAEWKYGFDLEKTKLCDLYILDGVPYDHNGIDTILTKYDKSDIGLIVVVEPGNDQTWFHRDCDLLTLLLTKQQTNKEKRELLNKVKEIYNERVAQVIITDYQCADCPLMTLNDTLIWNPYERKRIINELTVDKIEYIVNISQPLNTKTFGATGKNGIVEITTK
jgi:hypothetical protein